VGAGHPQLPLALRGPERLPEADVLDRLGFVEIREVDPSTESGLWVPHRCLEIVKTRVVFEGVDLRRSLLFAAINVTAMSEEGDFCKDFDLWLSCEYRGALYDQG
jgi:hypothetical protein